MMKEDRIRCFIVVLLSYVSSSFAESCQRLFILESTTGIITGPGYPGSYPNNVVHCWRIYAPLGNVTRLEINLLNMEVCSGCSCDSIEVYNGYSELSSRIGKYCSKSWRITSTGQYLFVKFISDASGSGTAFTANYYTHAKDFMPDDGDDNNNDNDNTDNKDDDNRSVVEKYGSAIGGGIAAVFLVILFCVLYIYCCNN